ncbi:hypothetical protein NE237_017319 [Protea cynaroides]|uniref:Uncharacterized protein n=1 Tax=Protea cynaroides TaxID=273540 RepID=A0A9Q0QMR7_9MAGN|nr:hypothetical protein NE237_017319 [Protea cynaroides]
MVIATFAKAKMINVANSMGENLTTLLISCFILIPQFFFGGVAESFTYSGQLGFFITRAPKGMKAMSTVLFLLTIGFEFFVSSLLVIIVKQVTGTQNGTTWLASNINYDKLYYFYALPAVLSSINYIFFVLCAIWYVKKKHGVQIESIVSSSDEKEKYAMEMESTLTASAKKDHK